MIDINVLMDVFQNRFPYYTESAAVLAMVERGEIIAVIPAHALTTLYYLVRKHSSRADAETAMDRVLDRFEIGNLEKNLWHAARSIPMEDFEDAVTAITAHRTSCSMIITRNTKDFIDSPVPAVTPLEFLGSLPPPVSTW